MSYLSKRKPKSESLPYIRAGEAAIKIKYNREDETLLVWLADGLTVDHAEQQGDFILHVDKADQPVLLEVLNAGHFVVEVVRALAESHPESQMTSQAR